MEGDTAEEMMANEFFNAERVAVNSHEEWLLRLAAALMRREAEVVSVLEARAAPSSRRGRCPRSTRSMRTETSIGASSAPDEASWSES